MSQPSPLVQLGNLMLSIRPGSACDYHRITVPYLRSGINPKSPVFVFNRMPMIGPEVVKQMKSSGVKIVCDVDDHFLLDADHHLSGAYAKSGIGKVIEICVRMADVVTATNSTLATEMRRYNPNVEIVPNALPFDEGQFTLSPDRAEGTTFIYAGGSSHYPDIRLLPGAIDDADLTIAGYEPQHPEWQRVAKIYPKGLYKPVLPLDGYMELYDGHRAAIAPLRDTLFNRCKSNLKALEAGAKGIPLLASKVAPYMNDKDKEAVLYASTPAEWLDISRRLQKDKAFAEDAGAKLAAHVRTHYQLRDANELRRQIIESL